MGTLWVKEFTGGLDTRRLPETTKGGVLLQAENGHITRGGEFEKRARFVDAYHLPAGTVGLAFDSDRIYVFGSGNAPAGMPADVGYQKLVHTAAPTTALVNVSSFDLFQNKIYATAQFADGRRYHFYNTVAVPAWVDGRARASFSVTAGHNTPAKQAVGIARVTGGTNGVQNTITSLKVGTTQLLKAPVQHDGNNATTAAAVAQAINDFVTSPDFTATTTATAGEISISPVIPGASANGLVMTFAKTGDFALTFPSGTALGGGVDASVSTMTFLRVNGVDAMQGQIQWQTSNAATAARIASAINDYRPVRDYEAVVSGAQVSIIATEVGTASNTYPVTMGLTNGFTVNPASGIVLAGGVAETATTFQPGDFVYTYGTKVYAVSGAKMHYSGIKNPNMWVNDATFPGAGFIDMSMEVSGSEQLQAFAKYQTYLAVFAESQILIWYVDPDDKLNKMAQALNNTGSDAPHSVTQFGDNDIFYLDESGLRSLRARDSSNSAATADIGVLVDTLITETLRKLTPEQRKRVYGLIDPRDGRFWLTMGSKIFVFSYFSGAKVSAWSTYTASTVVDGEDVPFEVQEAVVFRRRIYVRSGDIIYVYGGLTEPIVYDTTECFMQLPYLDGETPAKTKNYSSWDAAVRGTWEIEASMDPTNLEAVDKLGTVVETTYPQARMPMQGASPHISLTFRTRSAMAARVGAGLIRYSMDGDKEE